MQKNEDKIGYLLDRVEIQDKIASYGLGQDLHQPDADNELFTPDAAIDVTSLGLKVFTLPEYAELMRGEDLKGGGLEVPFKAWQHLEGQATVTIDGNAATSLAPHLHTHATRDGGANLFDAGYWHDNWVRTPDGWRIRFRRHQSLYTNTFPVVAGPAFLRN